MVQELPRPKMEDIRMESETNHEVLALQFVPVTEYTTFRAEFAITAGDIVFHFFKTPEVEALGNAQTVKKYWAEDFATTLEDVAKKVFNADAPRIRAQHVYDDEPPHSKQEPLDSWWFRAYGFGHLLDPHALAGRFVSSLDASLDNFMRK
jgi:hypothetical protein